MPVAAGFVATEYVSQGGYGSAMIKMNGAGRWTVRVWTSRGFVPVAEGCPTVDDAFTAYATWCNEDRPLDIGW